MFSLLTATLGFVLIWLANENADAVTATIGGIIFGGAVVFGVIRH
jgi:hypothetical protein